MANMQVAGQSAIGPKALKRKKGAPAEADAPKLITKNLPGGKPGLMRVFQSDDPSSGEMRRLVP